MPTYIFSCSKCDKDFDVIMSIKEYERRAECPTCHNVSTDRVYTPDFHFIGAAVQNAEYNPAFGQVVKNSRHRNELAKEKGLIEIGNEKPETVHKHYEQARADKLKKSWDDV